MYQIILKKRAKKFIGDLPKNERELIVAEIEKLPDGEDIKPMQGHKNLFRLRVGSYRILYTVDNNQYIVLVIDAGNRGDIYKRY
ncbi:MAG: type II toxin-antitoxin system RelE/ParE family toxin [Lachnospiraceae bacterium]|nr:type II toxin-antitoxin system RelE/ParE family toxin [Lachnospiraceae bacterium]